MCTGNVMSPLQGVFPSQVALSAAAAAAATKLQVECTRGGQFQETEPGYYSVFWNLLLKWEFIRQIWARVFFVVWRANYTTGILERSPNYTVTTITASTFDTQIFLRAKLHKVES